MAKIPTVRYRSGPLYVTVAIWENVYTSGKPKYRKVLKSDIVFFKVLNSKKSMKDWFKKCTELS